MAEFGGALDAYLEAPYVNAAKREAEFETWAEANLPDLDWDDDAAMDQAWDDFDAAWDDVPEPPEDDRDPRDDDDRNDWEG
jgi:hypothetical protein